MPNLADILPDFSKDHIRKAPGATMDARIGGGSMAPAVEATFSVNVTVTIP